MRLRIWHDKRTHARGMPGGSPGGAGAPSKDLNISSSSLLVFKRLPVPLLAPLSLHTSPLDVPSPDVNLKGSALPADPQISKNIKIIKCQKLKFWEIIKNSSNKQ